jgi:spore coat polysaccharide biosynthesis protein SpsF (cytidylyltransferase family)
MIGIFITARLGSTRLSEKHIIEVNGKPFIVWLTERFSTAFKEEIDNGEIKIFITTSIKPENKKFNTIFKGNGIFVYQGADENIPLRHLECALKNKIDYIISIDGDDILCSTEATRIVIDKLSIGSKMVQTSGLPLGMNSMGYTREFLKTSLNGKEREKLETGWGQIFNKKDIDLIELRNYKSVEKIRMTLDYQEDVDFFKKVISEIDVLNVSDNILIESILNKNLSQINSQLNHKYWTHFNNEMKKENL